MGAREREFCIDSDREREIVGERESFALIVTERERESFALIVTERERLWERERESFAFIVTERERESFAFIVTEREREIVGARERMN